MKKNKRNGEFSSLLRKYKITYMVGFISLFFILSLLLGGISAILISSNYLYNSKISIKQYTNSIKKNTEALNLNIIKPSDPRMVVRFFYIDSLTGEMQSVLVGIDDMDENIKKAYSYAFSTKDFNEKLNDYYTENIGNFTNLCFTEKVSDGNLKIRISSSKIENIDYIKVYMNIAGEESARASFFNVYIICAIAIVILSAIFGWIMAVQGIKPLNVFVKKQMDFVSDASHELRTPIAVVQSKLENIVANPDQSVYDASEGLIISLNELRRLNKLTTELLTLARSDKDTINLELEYVNVDMALRDICAPFIEIAQIQDKRLSYTGCDDVYAYLDVDKLKQIMIINIDNALKYTDVGDNIDIVLSQTLTELIIEIIDNGEGINEYTKEHIFERFYREDKARSRETGGNGLGLAIANSLVKLQKGKITVDHNFPKGTKFTISFPKARKKQETTND